MVTSRKWGGPEDDTEEVVITNIACQTKYRGIAIRASDSASIHNVYIDGLITREWDGYTNSILIGGIGYGKPSHPGKINNIYATNINRRWTFPDPDRGSHCGLFIHKWYIHGGWRSDNHL